MSVPTPRLLAFAVLLLPQAALPQSDAERQATNRIYSSERHLFKTEPNSFLVAMIQGRSPGTALDVGMGQGRNALWLAARGWDVTGFDISDVAIAEAEREAHRRKLKLTALQSGYQNFNYGEEKWDLIVLSYFFPRDLPARLFDAIRPGGLVLVEYYHTDAQKVRFIDGTDHAELAQLFSRYRILHYEDIDAPHDWGVTLAKKQRLVRLLAQKPVPLPSGCTWYEKPYAENQTACWTERNVLVRCEASGWRYVGPCSSNR